MLCLCYAHWILKQNVVKTKVFIESGKEVYFLRFMITILEKTCATLSGGCRGEGDPLVGVCFNLAVGWMKSV